MGVACLTHSHFVGSTMYITRLDAKSIVAQTAVSDERAFLRPRKIEAAAIQHPVAAGLIFEAQVRIRCSCVGIRWRGVGFVA
jgi:hypothetical protein